MASTFYVMPARDVVGQHFVRFLAAVFPGMDWGHTSATDLADTLNCLAEMRDDVFVVPRDELDDDAELEVALIEDYGAEKGDLVVEVPEPATPPTPARLWRITQEVEMDDDNEDIAWDDEDEVITAGAED